MGKSEGRDGADYFSSYFLFTLDGKTEEGDGDFEGKQPRKKGYKENLSLEYI
jgi:hypothetical protein